MTPEDKQYFENLLKKQTQHFDETVKEIKEDSERHMGVLNEHFKSQVVGVAEQYTSLKDSTNERFDKVDERLDDVEGEVKIANEKLDEVLDILKANQETLIEHDRIVEELQKA